jgi:hypothetical protein
MARFTGTTTLTKIWLKEYAAGLKRYVAIIESHIALMETLEISEVEATHYDTSQVAVDKLQKFCGAISLAVAAYHASEQKQQKTPNPKAIVPKKRPGKS